MHNLHKCNEAITARNISVQLYAKKLLQEAVLSYECRRSLLSLATTKAVDGIFYCSVLKTPVDDRYLCIARYFEYAAFNGYFEMLLLMT